MEWRTPGRDARHSCVVVRTVEWMSVASLDKDRQTGTPVPHGQSEGDSRAAGRHGLTSFPGAELGDGAVLQVYKVEECRCCGKKQNTVSQPDQNMYLIRPSCSYI